MNQRPNSQKNGILGTLMLPIAEYLAENAYVAPGFHRLLNAAGLATGLWGGRQVMDVVTARNSDGSTLSYTDTPVILRPLYAKMTYNPYSDDASDRWKFVVDKLAPAIPGALGAWAGSYHFAHGLNGANKPFHGPTATVKTKMEVGKEYSLQISDSRMRSHQADRIRPAASAAYSFGGTSGFQVLGAAFPFSNSWSAVVFQVLHERIPTWPGATYLNRVLFGNRSAGISDSVRPAMVKAARWAEVNLIQHGNLDWLTPERLDDLAQNALQSFKPEDITPEVRENVKTQFRKLFESAERVMQTNQGKSAAEIHKAVYTHLTDGTLKPGINGQHSLLGYGFDNLLHQSGVPLTKAEIGGFTPFSFLGRLFGSHNAEREVEAKWAKHLKEHYQLDYGPSRIPHDSNEKRMAWVAGGATVGGMGAAIAYSHQQINHRLRETPKHQTAETTHTNDPNTASDSLDTTPAQKENSFTHWLNGKPLDAMQWIGRVAITPPSMHRLMCASSLSLALIGGSHIANALAGRELKSLFAGDATQSLLKKENVWQPLQSLHGLLSYTPGSVEVADRFKQAAHFLIPVVVGGAGTLTGSKFFFRDRTEKLRTPDTLEDFADKVSLVQSRPFGALTAVTSIFNTGSGLHLVPFLNYSSNMQNRYLMASGQQVAMPVLGKWWSGNAGLTPWGVKGTLEYITNYLTYNPDERPRELPALVETVLCKLYPDLPFEAMVQHKQAMIDQIYAVRDRAFEGDNAIQKDEQRPLKRAMKSLLSGAGFEGLLIQAGLDPAQANLAANGMSGKIANTLGAKKEVTALQEEYRAHFHERVAKHEIVTPARYLESLTARSNAHAERVETHAITPANDRSSFVERVQGDPTHPQAVTHIR